MVENLAREEMASGTEQRRLISTREVARVIDRASADRSRKSRGTGKG
jgi:hypothetical protein